VQSTASSAELEFPDLHAGSAGSDTPTFRALRAVVSADESARYELLFADEGQDTTIGPLREFAARGALAGLGFAGIDIDAWIEQAPLLASLC
jgi:hypothetical protein